MPLISWKDHMEANMKMVQIKVLAAFILGGKPVEAGETVTVAKGFAREMIAANKAEMLLDGPAPAAAPPSTESIVQDQPDPPAPKGAKSPK
jgi:hypothetical protein